MSLLAALSVLTATFVGSYVDEVAACAGIKLMDAPPAYMDQREIWDQEHAMRLLNLLRRTGIEEFKDQESVAGIEGTQNYKMKPNRIINVLKGAGILQSSESAGRRQRCEDIFGTNETDYDDNILYIENPVEARLPGHRISIRLLREIMMARSVAANIPFTTTSEATATPQEGKQDAVTGEPSTERNNHVTDHQVVSNETEKAAGNAEDKSGDKAEDKSGDKTEDKGGDKADDQGADKAVDKGGDHTETNKI